MQGDQTWYREPAQVEGELIDSGELLPVGEPIDPLELEIPRYQYAWALLEEVDGTSPDHGEPLADEAEREIIVEVGNPGPNEALVYMLTSEVNYNDVWAITGIPVSTFRNHDLPYHVTGSGGLGLVVEVGDGAAAENRVSVGDLVQVYSGQYDLLSPRVGRDPMAANFRIQGYQTPGGTHQQFATVQATQLFTPPSNLDFSAAGSYLLTMGTIYRALFTTLDVEPDSRLFVEGASTGTGRDTTVMATQRGLDVTGMVSSGARSRRAKAAGAHATVDRTAGDLPDAMTMVPHDEGEWDDWERAGQPLLDAFRAKNDGSLADYAVSHAGEAAFSRTHQLLAPGGRLTFFGASTGYEMAFLGKEGSSTPAEMFARCNLRGGDDVLVWYGTPDGISGPTDAVGEEAIETALTHNARVAVLTETADQAAHVDQTYDVTGTVSLEAIADANDDFEWQDSLPRLPKPAQTEALAKTVGEYSTTMFKPVGKAVGDILQTPTNPRGNADVVFERAGQNTLALSTMVSSPFLGNVVYAEAMGGNRYSFYAPQVWMRQRRIYMPSTEIFGTHMKNPYEAQQLNGDIERGEFDIPQIHVTPWEETPRAHQDVWDNTHEEGSYVINHALPRTDISSIEDLYEVWGL